MEMIPKKHFLVFRGSQNLTIQWDIYVKNSITFPPATLSEINKTYKKKLPRF